MSALQSIGNRSPKSFIVKFSGEFRSFLSSYSEGEYLVYIPDDREDIDIAISEVIKKHLSFGNFQITYDGQRRVIEPVLKMPFKVVEEVEKIRAIFPREEFLFVRHGKTDWNKDLIKQGPLDLPLNKEGEIQAEKAALLLKDLYVKQDVAVISSELRRTRQTAETIAKALEKTEQVFPNIHERYFGDFRLLEENQSEGTLPADAETNEIFKRRIYESFNKLLKEKSFKGSIKIIVSHSMVFECLSFLLTGEKAKIDFGEICLFSPSDKDERWNLQKIVMN